MKKLVTAITTTTIALSGASAMNASADVHEVVKRDTLWDISQKHGTTVDQLMKWNHLTSSLIHPGQKISYTKEMDKPKATVKPKVKKQLNTDTHTVVAGDTLSEIAYEYGVTYQEVMEWNNLSTTLIFPNQELKIKKSDKKVKQTSNDSAVNAKSESTKEKVTSKATSDKETKVEKENVQEEKRETKSNSSTKTNSTKDQSLSDEKATTTSGDTYTVASGDTLSEIAFAHNVSFNKLMEWNNLSSTIIVPGQTLTMNGVNTQASNNKAASQESNNHANKAKPKQNEQTSSDKQEQPKQEEKVETNNQAASHQENNIESNKKVNEEKEIEKVEVEKDASTNTSNDETMTVTATAYTAECEGCTGITATGIDLNQDRNKKVIAVDPTVIPLGSTVQVEGYGTAIAGDVGGAIKGNIIDVHLPTREEAINWGRRTVNIEILD